MTPEREASIRKIAARDGESWRSSKVSNLALRETVEAMTDLLAELDALRAKVGEHKEWCSTRRKAALTVAYTGGTIGAEYRAAMLSAVIDHACEIGLFEASYE